MPKTTKSDVIIPEIFDQALEGAFSGKEALMGSALLKTGAAIAQGDFGGGANDVGDIIKVPYFGVIGDFEDIVTDGDPLSPKKIAQDKEQATVAHAGIAFEVSRWARNSAGKDIYEEAARQVVLSAQRKMDAALVAAATAAGGLLKDVYSASSPVLMNYDLMVDGKMMWGDEQDDIVAMCVHSKVFGDMLKLKDGTGRPLLTLPDDGSLPRFMGVPVATADRNTIEPTLGAVTSAGTSPPTLTLSGTPLGAFDLRFRITVGGTLGVSRFQFSTDGGNNWSAALATAASVPLVDTAVDSLVGINGSTGITAAFAAGTANTDNTYTAPIATKFTSMLLKKGSLAFWYNKDAIKLRSDVDILTDTDVAALHLYYAAIRYRRYRGGSRSGIVRLKHN